MQESSGDEAPPARSGWIVAPRMEGMAFTQPSGCQHDPFEGSMLGNYIDCVLRAGRIEPATSGKKGGEKELVHPDYSNGNSSHAWFLFK